MELILKGPNKLLMLSDNLSDRISSVGADQKISPFYPPEPEEFRQKLSDEVLIQKAFQRDPTEGLSMLFRRYYTPLCSHAIRYVSSREVAEDIVADVFVQFHSRQSFNRIQTSYRAYLYRAVRNLSLRYLRDEVTLLSDSNQAAQNAPEDKPSIQHQLEADEIRWHLHLAIENLSLPLQRVFVSCRIEGKRQAIVAQELGISAKTVEVYVSRAFQQIRRHMRAAGLLCIFLFLSGF